MLYKHLLFDLDHTLLDFDLAEELALTYVLEEAGVESHQLQTYKDHYIPMNKAMWEDLAQGGISKPDLLRTRFAKLFGHFGEERDGEHLAGRYQHFLSQQGQTYDQAASFLTQLKDNGFELYAATNGVSYIQRGRLAASGLDQQFDQIFISDEVGAHKPSVTFYAKIAEQIGGFQPSQALMIGDSLTADIQGGNNAGIDSIWYNPKGLVNTSPAQPTYVAQSYQDILMLLGLE